MINRKVKHEGLPNEIAIIGVGLIGGSIALGLKARGYGGRIVGFDFDPAAVKGGLESGALDGATDSAGAAVHDAGLVVLAAPVDASPALCREIAPNVGPTTIVTDVGSAKRAVVAAGQECFGSRFVGGHPMAGSERHGIHAADAELFEGASWILTPTDATSSAGYDVVRRLATSLGATPIALAPDAHDALLARLSHLPQLTASLLVEVAAGNGDTDPLLALAGAGFRDVTRIAASNPDLWVAILRCNRTAVLDALERLSGGLTEIATLVEAERWSEVHAFLNRARTARLSLFAKPDYGDTPVTLSLLVPDRPGLLAEVTTEAGRLGANLEDLRIVHSTEGGRGRLELVVAGEEAAEALTAALTALGYHVTRGLVE